VKIYYQVAFPLREVYSVKLVTWLFT